MSNAASRLNRTFRMIETVSLLLVFLKLAIRYHWMRLTRGSSSLLAIYTSKNG